VREPRLCWIFLWPAAHSMALPSPIFLDDVTAEGLKLFIRAAGNFAKFQVSPLINAEEFKEAMEKAKNVKSSYTPPTATKQ